MSKPIFISYRIADTLAIADRLAAELHRTFGRDAVYFDRRTEEPGDVWDEDIETAVTSAQLVLVLIELGFFFGRLGRNRVCLLKEPTIEEFPSDLHGIVYTEITLSADSDWREQLVRELTAMGLRAQAGSIAGSG